MDSPACWGSRHGLSVVFGQTWESLHLREPPSSMRTHQRGEITDWEYCNYCTFPHAWIAFDKTLKKFVLNRAHHDATCLCAEWKYKWWVLQGNSIIMLLIIKMMLWGSGQNTHTHTHNIFWSTQNIYCFLKLEWALIQSLYHVINKCNGLHKCRKEPDKKIYTHDMYSKHFAHYINTSLCLQYLFSLRGEI